MPKKRKSAAKHGTDSRVSKSLPFDLQQRLQAVWQEVGHLIDWCDSATAWTRAFCAEARPYRETFYWESVVCMVFDFLARHPATAPEDALSDCLMATQCPPCSDDPATLKEFQIMWQEIMCNSRADIDAFMEADLALAKQQGNYDVVKALYEGDRQAWHKG